ncbi:hypothetical protein F5Y12DRAFT_718154 [Xylaria sp. FL1777]|nr:hypothetical protein F5Y12DRAFT_718154 [Xylaria sp. FL1777]
MSEKVIIPAAVQADNMTAAMNNMTAALNNLTDALNNLTEGINGMRADLNGMHADLNRMDTRIQSGEKTAYARLWNGRPLGPSHTLRPLVAPSTGEVVPNFPATVADFENLTSRQVNDILRHLEQPVEGTSDEKRQQLMIYCGITLRVS